jgi:endonuclease-3
VILSTLFDEPYLAVDTHVHRVLNRLGIVNTSSALQTDKVIEKEFTPDEIKNLHHRLVLFGRYYCTSKSPKCNNCELRKICNFYKGKKLI